MSSDTPRQAPNLSGIPETMLWTLHNRVSEAKREDGIITDPKAIEIYQSIDYDYERSFGPAEPLHACRSFMFDVELQAFLAQNPNGVIINLGEGLETQRYRIAGDEALWITIDLPEAIEIRERFIQPDDHHLHIAASALDDSWYNAVPQARPKFITAQGLMMYLTEEQVRTLLQNFAVHFPGAYFMFDVIPRWLSRRTTTKGWRKTAEYTLPQMPWGINRHEIKSTLSSWISTPLDVTEQPLRRSIRGIRSWYIPTIAATPIVGRYVSAVVKIHFSET